MEKLNAAKAILANSKNTVFITGYKVLEESKLPDIQTREGWWNESDPKIASSLNTLNIFYDKFREFYSMIIKDIESCKPNNVHSILAKWQEKGIINSIVTQCSDEYHEQAGASTVFHVNGKVTDIICKECSQKHTTKNFLNNDKCELCGSDLRPDMLLYGDQYREYEWFRTLNEVQTADVVVLVGTNLLLDKVKEISAAKLIIIDDSIERYDAAEVILHGNIDIILSQLNNLM